MSPTTSTGLRTNRAHGNAAVPVPEPHDHVLVRGTDAVARTQFAGAEGGVGEFGDGGVGAFVVVCEGLAADSVCVRGWGREVGGGGVLGGTGCGVV